MGCTTSKAVPVGEDTSYGEHTNKVGNGKHQASQPADGAYNSTAGRDGETPDIVPLEQHNGDAEPTASENNGVQEEVIQASESTDVQSSPVPGVFADEEAANNSSQVAENSWVVVSKTEETSVVETAVAADGDTSISGPIADVQDTSAVLHISEEQDDQLSHASPEDQVKDASVVSHDADVSTSAQKEDVEDKPLPADVTTGPSMPTEATTISSFSNEVAATESATSIEAAEASTTEVTSPEPASVPVDEVATTVEVLETVCTEPASSDVDPQQSELASKSDEALPEESQPATDQQDQEASALSAEAVEETTSESEQKGEVQTVGEKIVQEVIAEAVRQVETSVQNDEQAAADHFENQEHHDASLSDEDKAKAAIKIQAGLRGMRDRKYVKALKSQEECVNRDHVTEQPTSNGEHHETDDTAASQPEEKTTPAVAE